jgi:hypothetical protein
MRTIRCAYRFHCAIHIISAVSAMNMQIHKSRRNISIGDCDGTHTRRSKPAAVYGHDPPAQNVYASVFQDAIPGESNLLEREDRSPLVQYRSLPRI